MKLKKDEYYLELESKGYYKDLDKRTKDYKEYKEWKSDYKGRRYESIKGKIEDANTTGLGDVIEKVAEVTGIKKVVEAVSDALDVDCGCDERKDKFNKLKVWRRRNLNCISKEDYSWINDYIENHKGKYTYEQRDRVTEIHNSIFNTQHKVSNCAPCINGFLRNIEDYLKIWDSE